MMPTQKIVQSMQSPSIRLELLAEAWRIFLAHPWLGVGWGQFAWHDFLLAEEFPHHTGLTHHAHNLVLQLMAETGLAGLLPVAAGLALWLYGQRQAALDAEHGWLYAMLSILGVHSLLEYPLWYAYFLGPMALLLGLSEIRQFPARVTLGPVVAAGMLAFGILGVVRLEGQYRQLEGWFSQAASGRMDKRWEMQVVETMGVLRGQTLLAPYLDRVIARVLPITPETLADKAALVDLLVRQLPDQQEVYTQAMLQAIIGHDAAARQQLRRALIRYPGGANKFAVQLVRAGRKETLPLLLMLLKHNLTQQPGKLKILRQGRHGKFSQ